MNSGFQLFPAVLEVAPLLALLQELRPGNQRRILQRVPALVPHLSRLHELARCLAGEDLVLCRSILFDKHPGQNWKVGWHQDVTLACRHTFELPGWGPWTVKDGLPHVQPPSEVLQAMVTLRCHLDPCGEDNGPLVFLPGTHGRRLEAEELSQLVGQGQAVCCTASAGDVLAMRPLLIHRSGSARVAGRRRVLHLEYCPRRCLPPQFEAE